MILNNTPFVSVIIPTWNRQNTLLIAIESVLNQSIPVHEVLICDDGSTDNSREIVKSINDPRVKWISGEHAGLPAVPRNRGVRIAKGEWVAFLDSDDIWFKRKLEIQLNYANNSGTLAVSTNALIHNVKNNLKKIFFEDKESTQRINFPNLASSNKVITSSVLLHKSILERVGFFSEEKSLRAIEDYELWLRVATLTDFLYISEPLVQYTDDIESSVRFGGVSYLRQKKLIIISYSNWIIRSYPFLFWNILIFISKNLILFVFQLNYKLRELIAEIWRGGHK